MDSIRKAKEMHSDKMTALCQEQTDALRFYEGDIDKTEAEDRFYGDAKAYVTWNALLFEGMETEEARTEENRVLNEAFLEDPDRVIHLSNLILSSMTSHSDVDVFRVERLADYQMFMKTGILQSFISTSKNGFLGSYEDKNDLVLMKMHIPSGVPYADMAELLQSYAKAEEAEILLPPYLTIHAEKLEMTEDIMCIRDRYGKPPAVYCQTEVENNIPAAEYVKMDAEIIDASKRVYHLLNAHENSNTADVQKYLQYKEYIRYGVMKGMRNG